MSFLDTLLSRGASAQTSTRYPYFPVGEHIVRIGKCEVNAAAANGAVFVVEGDIVQSSNPEARGTHCSVAPLTGGLQKEQIGYGNLKSVTMAVGSSMSADLDPTDEDWRITEGTYDPAVLKELGVLGVVNRDPAQEVRFKGAGLYVKVTGVPILKKGQSLPMTKDNSYTKLNWSGLHPDDLVKLGLRTAEEVAAAKAAMSEGSAA